LRRIVHSLGMRYYVNRRPIAGVRRTADLVFPRAKVAVFIDGCFWHGCPDHHTVAKTNAAYWAEKVRRNRERDRETNQLLADAGWEAVRVWEHEDPVLAAQHLSTLVQVKRAGIMRSRDTQASIG